MRFNETTHTISICVLILTILYALIYSNVNGFLICSAVAFIVAAFIDQIELITVITILFVLLYTTVLKKYIKRHEGFDNNPADITGRLRQERDAYEKPFSGASSVKQSFMEGFSNPDDPKNESAPAPSATKEAVDPKAVKEVTTAIDQKKKDETQNNVGADASNKDIATEEFQSATNELFKLGKMPSEHKDGPMLDAGSTIMKAMSSFDPETTSKMTNDTKQLLETQKSLMGMLTQMRPILADGKELLQTFSGMFGNQANAGPFKLAK